MRTFLLYAVLVGLPLVGTSLVLEGGRHLQAPPAVAGGWTIDPERDGSRSGCSSGSGSGGPATLVVGQSGDILTIGLGDTIEPLAGRMDWGTADRPAIATLPLPADNNSVEGALVSLHAIVDRASAPPTMQGTMTTVLCGTLTVSAFSATWRPESKVKAGH